MTTIKGFLDNFDNMVNERLKHAILNRIPEDLRADIENEGGEIVIDYTNKTFILRGCTEELSKKVQDALGISNPKS